MRELIKKILKEETDNKPKDGSRKSAIEMVLNEMILPEYEHVICGFEVKEPHERFDTLGNTPFKFMSVTIIFIGGIGTKLWPQTQGVQRMYDDVMDEVWDVIYTYTNEAVDVYHKTVKDCGKENIYLRESKENYSPAGKEITPNKIVIHKSTPKNRDRILEQGLKVRAGECYKTYAGYGEKCIPAIFATNSVNKRAWFNSSYDDDIWEIDTTMIPDVKWYKDNHYEPTKKHIVTFENIPSEALTLKYEGTESGLMRESKNESKNINAAKEIINSMFDNVSFLEVKSKEKIIKVYFETISTAMNEDSWFVNVICDTIKDYTSLKAIPLWWRGSVTDKGVDLYIDTEIVRYDEEGNLINESKMDYGKLPKKPSKHLFPDEWLYRLDTDGENVKLYHYGPDNLEELDTKFFGINPYTKNELGWGKPRIYFYTNLNDKETVVNGALYKINVPLNDLYPFNKDPLNLYDIASKTYGNATVPVKMQAIYISDILQEMGYKGMIYNWDNNKLLATIWDNVKLVGPGQEKKIDQEKKIYTLPMSDSNGWSIKNGLSTNPSLSHEEKIDAVVRSMNDSKTNYPQEFIDSYLNGFN